MCRDFTSTEASDALVASFVPAISCEIQKRSATRVWTEGALGAEPSVANVASCGVADDCSGAASLLGIRTMNTQLNPDSITIQTNLIVFVFHNDQMMKSLNNLN